MGGRLKSWERDSPSDSSVSAYGTRSMDTASSSVSMGTNSRHSGLGSDIFFSVF